MDVFQNSNINHEETCTSWIYGREIHTDNYSASATWKIRHICQLSRLRYALYNSNGPGPLGFNTTPQ